MSYPIAPTVDPLAEHVDGSPVVWVAVNRFDTDFDGDGRPITPGTWRLAFVCADCGIERS